MQHLLAKAYCNAFKERATRCLFKLDNTCCERNKVSCRVQGRLSNCRRAKTLIDLCVGQ